VISIFSNLETNVFASFLDLARTIIIVISLYSLLSLLDLDLV